MEKKLDLLGSGKPGKNGAKNGDLFIKINISSDKKFKLNGYDLYSDLLLTPWEAALGTRIKFETFDDYANIYVPKGTISGEKLKIQNKGYKDGKGGRGDLILNVQIVVPKELSQNEIETYEKLKEISNFEPRK